MKRITAFQVVMLVALMARAGCKRNVPRLPSPGRTECQRNPPAKRPHRRSTNSTPPTSQRKGGFQASLRNCWLC